MEGVNEPDGRAPLQRFTSRRPLTPKSRLKEGRLDVLIPHRKNVTLVLQVIPYLVYNTSICGYM